MIPQPHTLPLTDIQTKTLRHLDTLTEMISGKVLEQMEKDKALSVNFGNTSGGGNKEVAAAVSSSSAVATPSWMKPPPMKMKRDRDHKGGGGGNVIDVVSTHSNLYNYFVLCVYYYMDRLWPMTNYKSLYKSKCYKIVTLCTFGIGLDVPKLNFKTLTKHLCL